MGDDPNPIELKIYLHTKGIRSRTYIEFYCVVRYLGPTKNNRRHTSVPIPTTTTIPPNRK